MKAITRRNLLAATTAAPLIRIAKSDDSLNCPISIGTYGLPGYTLEKAIELVAETGFNSIEFASMPGYHGAPDQISKKRRDEIRKRLEDTDLRLGALMGLPTPNEKKRAENSTWVEQLLELSNDLSPKHPAMIQSVLGGGDWDQKKNLFRDCLGPWIDLASKADIPLAIKPHRGHAMSLPKHGVWLIKQLNAADQLSLVYDHSHFVFRDLPIEETVAEALPYTSYLVMKDAVQLDGKVRFALPGTTGTIPHADILKQFTAGGYRGEICAEVSSQVWKSESYDPVAATTVCYTNLSRIKQSAL